MICLPVLAAAERVGCLRIDVGFQNDAQSSCSVCLWTTGVCSGTGWDGFPEDAALATLLGAAGVLGLAELSAALSEDAIDIVLASILNCPMAWAS